MRKDLKGELISKREIAIEDFELLSTDGVIGLYEECELTHIFLLENNTKSFYHYFGIISYEEYTEIDDSLKDIKLTNTLVPINNQFKLGIVKKRISKIDSENIFNQLCNGEFKYHSCNFVLPKEFQLLPKTHVPCLWGHDSVLLSRVLKPNFWGDRYILEFTALKNPMNNFLTDTELNKINCEIKNVIPIDLASVYDRIGSFVYQFPITLLSGHAGITWDWTKAKISMELHSAFEHANDLITTVTTKLDNIETGHHTYQGYFKSKELKIGDSNNLEFKIFNKKNGLIYKSSMGNFIRELNLNMGIITQNSEPRKFLDSEGNWQEVNLTLYSSSGITNKFNYDTRTKNRIIQNDIINKSGRFLNVHPKERLKALKFIRKILNEKAPSCSEVWLWDPFLNYKDIINTLYYIGISNLKMKCITSYKKYKDKIDEKKDYSSRKLLKLLVKSFFNKRKNKNSYLRFKEDQRNGFFKNNNNLGINLEFRSVQGNNGFDFHDRFLFLIPKKTDELPTVFSLGTSINGLGKSHHLIQQTLDPRNIIETFNELWNLLSNEESLIIKLPEDKNGR